MPATSAAKPATDHTMTQILLSGMPIDCAAWWSPATERRARPGLVFWKNSASTTTSSAGDHRGDEVFLARIITPPSNMPSRMKAGILDADVDVVDVAAEEPSGPKPSRK